jgi:hypothetical protein
MKGHMKKTRFLILLAFSTQGILSAFSSDLDTIGMTLLSATTTNLNGSGIHVAQSEAGAPTWEVNPSAVGKTVSQFTYFSSGGSSSSYPNALGSESGHADGVGMFFYAVPGGVATNVAQVDNYEAGYLYNSIITSLLPPNINDPVVNQSWIFSSATTSQQQTIDSHYDDYAAQYNVLFVSGVGNGGQVYAPATCYNGLGVAAYGGSSSIGPTLDNGRAKPDLTAPAPETSFSTPEVAGAAAVLLQAGLRGDGGASPTAAADIRTVKALLLNGSVKPSDWAPVGGSPLDARYGAGVLNVFNSYRQLTGAKRGYVVTTSVPTGSPHPPAASAGSVGALSAWDFNTVSSSFTADGINHYFFNLTNSIPNALFTGTATLVWNRQQNRTAINNLALFLYDANSSSLLASSTSTVDNVQQIFTLKLPSGRYDLQVFKSGGASVSNSETYALAFEFFAMPLAIAVTGNNLVLTWPVYPAGFVLESTPNLNVSRVWTSVSATPTVANGQNMVVLAAGAGAQFFRLDRP